VVTAGGAKKENGLLINGKIINDKILVHTAQWYITHTCNISCNHCLSYNNYNIKGHDNFKENLIYAKEWAKKIIIKDFTIVGGEVFTHNNLNQWVFGLREIFPDIENFKVLTNGTVLSKYADSFDKWFEKNIIIEISFKREEDYNDLYEILKRYKNVERKIHFMYDEAIYINGKLCFLVEYCDSHMQWGIKEYKEGFYEFYNSNSEEAHKSCWQKDCHYFYKGNLYKCGTIVGAQEFVKNFPVKEHIKSRINGYAPLKYDHPDLLEQIKSLNNHIPQCSLCPSIALDDKLVVDNKKILP